MIKAQKVNSRRREGLWRRRPRDPDVPKAASSRQGMALWSHPELGLVSRTEESHRGFLRSHQLRFAFGSH